MIWRRRDPDRWRKCFAWHPLRVGDHWIWFARYAWRPLRRDVRHEYRVLSDNEKADMKHVKDLGLEFYELMDRIGGSRELSLAKTKVEEAVMWAVKHITR